MSPEGSDLIFDHRHNAADRVERRRRGRTWAAVEVAEQAVRDRERRHQRQAGVGDEREHPASPGAVSHGDHEPQFGQQPARQTRQGSALATSCRVAFAVRAVGLVPGTTFQATS